MVAASTGLTVKDGTAADASAAFRTGVTVGNAVVSGTLAGYTVSGDDYNLLFTATTPGNKPDLTLTGSGASNMSVGITQGTNGAIDTVTASNFTGATSFNSDRSTVAVVFTGLAAGQAVGVIGDKAVVNGNLTGTYAAGVTAATLNVSGGTKGGP